MERQGEVLTRIWESGAYTLASPSHPTSYETAPPLSLLLTGCSSEPGLMGRLRTSAPMRLSGLESLRPSMVPWPQTPTSLLRPLAESEAIGLAGAVPPISPAGPQAR
jgi:hypothetical protein